MSHSEKDKNHTILPICGIKNRKQQTNKTQTHRHSQQNGGHQRVKRVKYTVMKGDWISGGEHTVKQRDSTL